jgi:hypothetical protein
MVREAEELWCIGQVRNVIPKRSKAAEQQMRKESKETSGWAEEHWNRGAVTGSSEAEEQTQQRRNGSEDDEGQRSRGAEEGTQIFTKARLKLAYEWTSRGSWPLGEPDQ